jgi:hypothetical protein
MTLGYTCAKGPYPSVKGIGTIPIWFDRRRRGFTVLLIGALVLASPATSFSTENAAQGTNEDNIVFYDAAPLFALDLNDPMQRRRFWDESHLLVSLQGLANRDAPRLFLRYVREPDDYWWQQMTRPGGWLHGRTVVRETSLLSVLQRFARFYRGAVLWDERVPATSNVASSIAGCDDLLCLRWDLVEGSLYRELTEGEPRLPVKVRLVGDNDLPLFTGREHLPGTKLASSGSAKCDAYLWLIEHYLKTGKANPQRMGYYLDAFWLQCWGVSRPVNHTLSNHDYVIAQRGLVFDLNVWDDEACVDDPDQSPGTDARTLKALLRAAWDRFNGQGMIHVAGFVPWAFKYTNHRNQRWSAGGQHQPVPTEWRYAEILSCYNAYMDADALGLGAMANASFFQHYPLRPHYAQNQKPTRSNLQARGLLDAEGRIVPRRYVAHYVGDYDAAAWLYQQLPRMWDDPARGSTPLSWAFNPNLAERFPLGMAWARERCTTNDFFVAGDSGAGYLNPGYLTGNRLHSGLPSGLSQWEAHCTRFYRHWDLSLTGFIIDGYGPAMTAEILEAYSRFSPDGIVAQKIPGRGVHGNMPFLRMSADLPSKASEAARTLRSLSRGPLPQFVVARSILKPPSWYAAVENQLQAFDGAESHVVDLYTLLWLVREYERHQADYVDPRWASSLQVSARPDLEDGLHVLHLADGPVAIREVHGNGIACWQVPSHQPPLYLYFDLIDAFVSSADAQFEVRLEYLDRGKGVIEMQYDSRDPVAPHGGAYKNHPLVVERRDSGRWHTVDFRVEDARFMGSQNGGADLRFCSAGDELLIRQVIVSRAR